MRAEPDASMLAVDDRAIVAGHRRVPASGDDGGWSDAASAAMIADEPW